MLNMAVQHETSYTLLHEELGQFSQ